MFVECIKLKLHTHDDDADVDGSNHGKMLLECFLPTYVRTRRGVGVS